MNNVKLVLDTEKLNVVNESWDCIYEVELITPEQKMLFDIASRLSMKFKKKAIDKAWSNGKFNISLFYHEAYFLNKVLAMHLAHFKIIENPYKYNVIFKIANHLNQKLV